MSHAAGAASPDAKHAAATARQVAGIGILTALLSGLMAFGATYLSADMAARSASKSVAQQLSGESDKSRAEFLRGQQQVLYSRVAADVQAVDEQQRRYIDLVEKMTSVEARSFVEDENNPFHQYYKKIERDDFEMSIIASTGTYSAWLNLYTSQDLMQNAILHNAYLKTKPPYKVPYKDSKNATDKLNQVQPCERIFQNAARADMGNK